MCRMTFDAAVKRRAHSATGQSSCKERCAGASMCRLALESSADGRETPQPPLRRRMVESSAVSGSMAATQFLVAMYRYPTHTKCDATGRLRQTYRSLESRSHTEVNCIPLIPASHICNLEITEGPDSRRVGCPNDGKAAHFFQLQHQRGIDLKDIAHAHFTYMYLNPPQQQLQPSTVSPA